MITIHLPWYVFIELVLILFSIGCMACCICINLSEIRAMSRRGRKHGN